MMDEHDMKKLNYDFGDDADVVPPADPAFDAWLAKAAPGLNEPNAVPRLEMWRAIQAARTTREDRGGRFLDVTKRRRTWGLVSAIAAALLLGVAIDRFMLRRVERPGANPPVASRPAGSRDAGDPAGLYRVAAARTLTQAEALLTAYRASGASQGVPLDSAQLDRWGREVLSSTRLLIDSPAGKDPMLRTLLDDLELVLVQIIQLSGAPLDPADRELIDRALADRDLLPRIRTAVPAGITGSASAD